MATLEQRITDFATAVGNYLRDSVKPFLVPDGGVPDQVLTQSASGLTWQAPGSDPWTYLTLAADQDVSTATFADLTGLSFVPLSNSTYEVEYCLMSQTATATVGARPGFSWAAGLSFGVVDLYTPSSATAETQVHATIGTIAGVAQAAVGGLPAINVPYGHRGYALFRSGSGLQGAFKVQMASETAGTAIRTKQGSFLKYRKIG